MGERETALTTDMGRRDGRSGVSLSLSLPRALTQKERDMRENPKKRISYLFMYRRIYVHVCVCMCV